jgi:hypothetical protein
MLRRKAVEVFGRRPTVESLMFREPCDVLYPPGGRVICEGQGID